jgi:hypothetical protein
VVDDIDQVKNGLVSIRLLLRFVLFCFMMLYSLPQKMNGSLQIGYGHEKQIDRIPDCSGGQTELVLSPLDPHPTHEKYFIESVMRCLSNLFDFVCLLLYFMYD